MLPVGKSTTVKNWKLRRVSERAVDVVGEDHAERGVYQRDGYFYWDRPEAIPEYVKKAAYQAVGSGTSSDPNRGLRAGESSKSDAEVEDRFDKIAVKVKGKLDELDFEIRELGELHKQATKLRSSLKTAWREGRSWDLERVIGKADAAFLADFRDWPDLDD